MDPVYDLRIIILQTDCKNFDLPFHNITFSDWTQSHTPGNFRENSRGLSGKFMKIRVTMWRFHMPKTIIWKTKAPRGAFVFQIIVLGMWNLHIVTLIFMNFPDNPREFSRKFPGVWDWVQSLKVMLWNGKSKFLQSVCRIIILRSYTGSTCLIPT